MDDDGKTERTIGGRIHDTATRLRMALDAGLRNLLPQASSRPCAPVDATVAVGGMDLHCWPGRDVTIHIAITCEAKNVPTVLLALAQPLEMDAVEETWADEEPAVRDQQRVSTATGKHLDTLVAVAGLLRGIGESDDSLRGRMLAAVNVP